MTANLPIPMRVAERLPEGLTVATAKLPASYEQVRHALASCTSIDECRQWSNKAAALASYARQAEDDSLWQQARRIQARAIRRCGDLLKEYNSQGARTELADATDGKLTQQSAARQAGMSERQQLTAVRVSNVPAEEFEKLVEEGAPSVSALAERGRRPNPYLREAGVDDPDILDKLHWLFALPEDGIEVRNYDELVAVLRWRRIELNISQMELDERAGFHTGYIGKLELGYQEGGRGVGSMSLPTWLDSLGVCLQVVPKSAVR